MHNANMFLAQQRVLELRAQANEMREGRIVWRARKGRSLRDRVRDIL